MEELVPPPSADAQSLYTTPSSSSEFPLRELVAAVSVGLVNNTICLDLDYSEDSIADVDLNVVKTESGRFVEIQGSAEHNTFDQEQLNHLLKVADEGIARIISTQRAILGLENSA